MYSIFSLNIVKDPYKKSQFVVKPKLQYNKRNTKLETFLTEERVESITNENSKREKAMDKKWIQKRQRNVKIYVFLNFTMGLQFSLTFTTLYPYLKDVLLLQGEPLRDFYSGISGIYYLSQIIFSLIICRWFDKHRAFRLISCAACILVVIGNILYTIPESPWLLFAGRFQE